MPACGAKHFKEQDPQFHQDLVLALALPIPGKGHVEGIAVDAELFGEGFLRPELVEARVDHENLAILPQIIDAGNRLVFSSQVVLLEMERGVD